MRGKVWKFFLFYLPCLSLLDRAAHWQHKLLGSGPYLPAGSSADVAIILGYALRRDGSPSKPLRERVEGGVQLYDERAVGYLVFSGGHPGGGIRTQSEAAAMEAYAKTIAGAVSTGTWLIEDQSTSTRENALLSLKFVEDYRWKNIVVATNPFHQLRSRLVFECAIKELFTPHDAPKVWLARVGMQRAEGAQLLYEPLVKQYNFFREILALVWYWYQGWLC